MTFEILDKSNIVDGRELRVVSAIELHADALIEESETPLEDGATPVSENAPSKSNVDTIDDTLNQRLTMAEIESMKQDEMGSSKAIIAKLLASHSTLDQKTVFSLAKYTLRKNKKYLRWFSVAPLDVSTLADWMMNEKDFGKVLDVRNETLSLMASWSNVHGFDTSSPDPDDLPSRFLVVDDTGGLIVAFLAERMGILYSTDQPEKGPENGHDSDQDQANGQNRPRQDPTEQPATITVIHSNSQPNLSLLRYFGFDYNNPLPSHPLYSRLKTVSWLQLVDPLSDSTYQEPATRSQATLQIHKSNRRAAYYRKRRRWQRVKSVVDSTRSGGFDGLVVASHTDPTSVLHHLVPLLTGGSQVVVYCPHIEPLADLADYYSTARRTAFLNTSDDQRGVPCDDFPVDPTLLLAPSVQTARLKRWQVLPGRTHPLMIGKGGAEGYLFVGTRVIPSETRVHARGRPPRKKQKQENDTGIVELEIGDDDMSDTAAGEEGDLANGQ